jgi:hypothetical protein
VADHSEPNVPPFYQAPWANRHSLTGSATLDYIAMERRGNDKKLYGARRKESSYRYKDRRTDAFKNGQRIGYFDHNLKCLILDGDNFFNSQTLKDWRAYTKAHQGEGVSQFLFQCIADLKADGKKSSIKVPYERLRARLKLRKIGLSNNWTPFDTRTLAYIAKFDTRTRTSTSTWSTSSRLIR